MIGLISRDEVKELLDSGRDIILLDVRDTPDYLKEHLPGARHLLITDMQARAATLLAPGATIVTYSKDINCPASTIAAQRLASMGYQDVRDYAGSFRDWKEAGLPTEKG